MEMTSKMKAGGGGSSGEGELRKVLGKELRKDKYALVSQEK